MVADSGEVSGADTIAKVKVKYVGCKENSSPNACTSPGAAAGTILMSELLGRIGYVSGLLAARIVGTELEPVPPNKVFATFTCSGLEGNVSIEGCTIGETKPTNVDQNTGSLLYSDNATLTGQLLTLIDGGTHRPCEQTVTASAFGLKGKGWLMDDELETFAALLELRA